MPVKPFFNGLLEPAEEEQVMRAGRRTVGRAFTLIELLVVVAIIALLMSILLPNLRCAREKARSAKCGVLLRGFGRGLSTYFTEYNDWIPGVNTTGVAATVAGISSDIGALRSPTTPVQNYDWMSPLLLYETELGDTRAKRFQTLVNEYRCPSNDGLTIDFLFESVPAPDRADFDDEMLDAWAPLSYLMPAHFQWWGQRYRGRVVAVGYTSTGRPIEVEAQVAEPYFEVKHEGSYQSRLDKLGPAARKIAVADGMRYLKRSEEIDFDIYPAPDLFGAFTSNGAWWCGSQAYGVENGTANWDGTPVNSGSDNWPEAQGRNMVWSYRHGCVDRGKITSGVRDNLGLINALFFDGHVARLDDRASRNIEYWYPSGSTTAASGALNGLTDVPNGYEVP
jgi:prepilin-type N-terminal cleavage/methylation domain-containing protein/prepilin-type processing-associated H-X9-DG protein